MIPNKILEILNAHDWDVDSDELLTMSPEGQDVVLALAKNIEEYTSIKEFKEELENITSSYDVSYETYIWLDNTGHGTNGAPNQLEDVLTDMKWVERELYSLCDVFTEACKE